MAITASISLSENSYSTANNTSSVTCKVTVKWTYSSNDRNNTTKTLTFNGTKYTTTMNINSSVTSSGSMTLFNKTLTVAHNSDGTKTVSASVRIPTNTSSGTVTASKSLTLTNIPRYPSVTAQVNAVNEFSATIGWSSNAVCDYVWYSLDWGTTWTAVGSVNSSSGTFFIDNLPAGRTYHALVRLRRKDSQLTANSSKFDLNTYAYPYANSTPNFTIGNALTIGLYNPLGRTVTVTVTGADGSQIGADTVSGTSITGYNNNTVVSRLYASIPNAKSGTYTVKVTYGSIVNTKTGGTYTVNASTSAPSFSGESYEDTNPTTTAITGDNKKLLPTRSTLKFDISDITARNGATISGATVTLNGTNYPMTISGSSATVSNVPLNSSGQNATITLTDSRGLAYSKSVPLDIVDYSAPNISATAERDSGFYSETDITPTVNYTSLGTNAVTINLKARKVGTTAYTVDQTIPDGQTTQVALDNEYAWEILLTVTDSLGGTGTYNITIARGLPLMYFDTEMNSVGLNQFPSHAESFEIAGDLYINASKLADFVIEEGTSGIWKYRKWNSGKSECWGQAESNNISNVAVNGWYGGTFTPPDFPSGLFVTTPHCWANLTYWGNGYHFGCAYSVSATRCSVLGIRNDNVSSKMYADIYAMGRWK